MTDFGDFFDDRKAASKKAFEDDAKRREDERQEKILRRQAELAPLYAVALPVFERAKIQLATKEIEVSWGDNAKSYDDERPVIELRLRQRMHAKGIGYLSVAGVQAVLRYKQITDRSGGLSIGNVALDAFDAADAERLVRHCIADLFPKP